MLKLSCEGSTIRIETMGGILTWDARCGGQISEFTVKDELFSHPLLGEGRALPDLRLMVNGKYLCLSEVHAEMTVTREASDYAKLMTRATLYDGALNITQEYEIHEEGALFCNLSVDTPAGNSFDLSDCSLNLAIDVRDTRNARWGYYTRQPKYKRDYSTLHAFSLFSVFRKPADICDERELFPFISLDLGWEATRFFSSHLEFFLEDWTSFNDGPLTQTCTRVGQEDGFWQAHWHFHEGSTVRVKGSYRYRNRWGFMFGRARTQSGPEIDPAVRNNTLGCNICHCLYPYVRQGDKWPWVSMPIKQIPEQPPQTFKGNPDLSRVDEAKQLGANTVILHQFWMKNPGSNNEPVADYRPFDPEWLRAFTERCHQLDMRVAYYIRGTEMWVEYSTFFNDFLKKDWDGMYADWNSPFCMGYVKCSPLHVSLHNYFHFTKALRRRVGAGGILMGHSGNACLIASACFDAAVGGEVSVRHDELLSNPESSVYFGGVNYVGGHLISGNLPDRIAFSSAKATAICAALGITSHPFMEPDIAFSERMAFIKPLWDAMNSLPGKVVRLHNPAYIPTQAVSTEADHLFPSLWQADSGKALLLVTNIAETSQSGVVELKLSELDMPKNATAQPLSISGTFTKAKVAGNTVRLENIPSLKFAALLIG